MMNGRKWTLGSHCLPAWYIFSVFCVFWSLVGSPYLSSPPCKLWTVSSPRLLWTALCSNWNCRRRWLVSQLAREESDKWHLESQIKSWGFLRLASKASQCLPVAPGLQACVLLLSRIPCLKPCQPRGPRGPWGQWCCQCPEPWESSGCLCAEAFPCRATSDPTCWDCWRLSANYGRVVLWDAITQGIAALLVLRHSWYIKAFVSSLQLWDILSLTV